MSHVRRLEHLSKYNLHSSCCKANLQHGSKAPLGRANPLGYIEHVRDVRRTGKRRCKLVNVQSMSCRMVKHSRVQSASSFFLIADSGEAIVAPCMLPVAQCTG
jgi:hypothetical protein